MRRAIICMGLPPSARGEIACGKLRSGAVSNTVPFRKGSASSLHHRDAACDAIELGMVGKMAPVKP